MLKQEQEWQMPFWDLVNFAWTPEYLVLESRIVSRCTL